MLDFSKMKNNATKRPATQGNGAGNSFISTDNKNAVAGECESDRGKSAFLAENEPGKAGESILLQAGKHLQRNLQRGELTAHELNKAIRDDRPPEEIAMIATKTVSLILSDSMIYNALAKKYGEKYGITLTKEPPYKVTRTE